MYENIIVIPYRNRKAHLDHFIKRVVPLIKAHLPNSKVVVVEQDEGKLFNRGAVLNVAFKEFKDKTKYFITHDVDINPTEKCIKEYYLPEIKSNVVKGIYTSIHGTLGGIVKISSADLHKVNGFPNNIWGWGAEDKALQNRTEFYGIKKETNFLNTSKTRDDAFFKIFNNVNDREPVHHPKNYRIHYLEWKKYDAKKRETLILESGLNNLEYKVLERKDVNELVKIIKVKI